jgi:hypothetical protein
MPIGNVYGVHSGEDKKTDEARKELNRAVSDLMNLPTGSVETFFQDDIAPDSFSGDVVLVLMSKSFFSMSEEEEEKIADVTNAILKKFFPSNGYVDRRLWETFFIPARSYGLT